MRRRPPRLIHLSPEEVTYLEQLVRDGRTEQRIARRARILLEMADPATIVSELADRLGQDRRTIWALCRRFEALGVDVVKDSYRPGRPRELSPPAACRGGKGAPARRRRHPPSPPDKCPRRAPIRRTARLHDKLVTPEEEPFLKGMP